MAKRFTDSEKWKKPWYRKLKPAFKVFWEYLRDNCDHAGIWEVDFELAEDFIGANLDRATVGQAFAKQVHIFADGRRWFILDFPEYQYGPLRETNNAHRSVIASLKKHRIWDVYCSHLQPLPSPSAGAAQGLARGSAGAQEKDQDQDQDQDQEKEDGGAGEETNSDPVAEIVAYLNAVTGKHFLPKTEGTAKFIRARLAEGRTVADFRKVIDTKAADWLTVPSMEPFLRPDTLFRPSNFESYLNQKNAGASHGTDSRHSPRRDSQAERNARAAEENYGPAFFPEGEHAAG